MQTANKPVPPVLPHADRTHSGTVETEAARRAFERCDVELEVTLESESNFYIGLTENLSEGGLFIATHLIKPIGTPISVTLKLPNSTAAFTASGTVRWIRQYSVTSDTDPGMGVRFEEVTPEQTALIREFLAARTPLFHDED
jgi:uncharacterized protein (TIGR02266 family)